MWKFWPWRRCFSPSISFPPLPLSAPRSGQLALCAALAVIVCLTALADCTGAMPQALFFASGALLSLSILMLCRPEGFTPPGRRLSHFTNHEEDSTDV